MEERRDVKDLLEKVRKYLEENYEDEEEEDMDGYVDECPICGSMHDGADEVCDECRAKLENSISRIVWVMRDYVGDLIMEESEMMRLPPELIEEGVKERLGWE